jgi:hypothetical protein
MNILELKRKSLGWMAREEGDGGGGYNSSNRNPDTVGTGVSPGDAHGYSDGAGGSYDPMAAAIAAADAANAADQAEANQRTVEALGGWSLGGGSDSGEASGPVGQSVAPTVEAAKAPAEAAAAIDANDPTDAPSATRLNLLGVMNPDMSVDPNQTDRAKLDAIGVRSTLDNNLKNYGIMTMQDKDRFASLSQENQEHNLENNHKPVGPNYTYNPVDPGFREAVTEATNPYGNGPVTRMLKSIGVDTQALGVDGAGVSVDQHLKNETTAELDKRMGIIGDAINSLGKTAINSFPLGRAVYSFAKNVSAYQADQQTGPEAVGNFAKDAVFGSLAGLANGIIGKAIGPDAMGAIGAYDKVASIGNALGVTSLPSVNLGGRLTAAGFNALGFGSTPQATNPSTGAGLSSPDGQAVPSTGGWSTQGSSEGGAGGVYAPSAPAAPTQAAPTDQGAQISPTFDPTTRTPFLGEQIATRARLNSAAAHRTN